MEIIQNISDLAIFSPELPPGDLGAPWVSNGVKTKIVVPRGPHQRPEVPPRSSKLDLAGKFFKSREKLCFGGSFRITKAEENVHARNDVRDGHRNHI